MANLKKLCLLSAGSYLMGIGVALATASTFGADSVALLWDGMSKTFGMTVGNANLLFSFLLLVAVFLMDRRQIGAGTILSPLIEGIAIDMVLPMLPQIEGLPLQLMMMFLGILILCIGTGIYAYSDFGRGPYIALTFILQERYQFSLTWIRTSFDLLCLVLGILLGAHLSIGPIASVIMCGYCTAKTIHLLGYLDAKAKTTVEKRVQYTRGKQEI